MNTLKGSILLVLFLYVNSVFAQPGQDTLKILLAGNSYSFFSNMPFLISSISENTNTKIITELSVNGGVTLSNHYNGDAKLKTKKMIKKGNYDMVILQEQSMHPINNPDEFYQFANKMIDYVRLSASKPFLYQTWAKKHAPETQDIISKAYEKVAIDNDAELIRVGEAWQVANELKPEFDLYMRDGSHQNNLGALLTACVFVYTLTNDLPHNLSTTYVINNPSQDKEQILEFTKEEVEFCLEVIRQMNKTEQ